ncbi:hypothetical protein SAMN05660649_02065 [Desulfotomaculum arcticum]|uniref:DUF2089 domain-containing protein n=1 Tax=Desulfotruncus arcticus DSM 17038 TaxID=1121424 RepID=A0A1I2T340_9FIRM|nr:hypothetical protein SAMN05660649_02065 [Desulfotomaculum arcticum] [Desulfotruncus arcticus DSM 17038]
MLVDLNEHFLPGVKQIKYKYPGSCPVCGSEMTISRLTCTRCPTKMEGEFAACKFCRLPDEQIEFIEVFIKCRGSIKDVEKELGISYPTVRNRLEGVIQALGYRLENTDSQVDVENRERILQALESGEISSQEAVRRLKKSAK